MDNDLEFDYDREIEEYVNHLRTNYPEMKAEVDKYIIQEVNKEPYSVLYTLIGGTQVDIDFLVANIYNLKDAVEEIFIIETRV